LSISLILHYSALALQSKKLSAQHRCTGIQLQALLKIAFRLLMLAVLQRLLTGFLKVVDRLRRAG